MSPKEGKALLMIVGDKKKKDADAEGASSYGEDLKAALGDLAKALGVQVKDPDLGVEALRAIHDVCSRTGEE